MAVLNNLDYTGATISSGVLTDNGVNYTIKVNGGGIGPSLLTDPLAIGLPSIRDKVQAGTPAGETHDRSEREIAHVDLDRVYHFGGTRYVPYAVPRYPFDDPDWCSLIQVWQATPVLKSPPIMVGIRLLSGVKYLELRAGNDATGQVRLWKTSMELPGDDSLLNHPWDFVLRFKFSLTAAQVQLFLHPWGGTVISSPLFTSPIGYGDALFNYVQLKTGVYRGPRVALPGQASTWWVDSARDKLGDYYSEVKPW